MAFKTWTNEVLNGSDVNTYLMNQAIVSCTSATRPSGVTGRRIWETDTRRQMHFNGSSWVEIKEQYAFAYKPEDTVINGTDKMQDDPHLRLNIYNTGSYLIDLYIKYQGTSTAFDMEAIFRIEPSDTTTPTPVVAIYSGQTSPAWNAANSKDSSTLTVYPQNLFWEPFAWRGPIWSTSDVYALSTTRRTMGVSGTVPFTMIFQYSQIPSDQSDLAVLAGSYIWVRRTDNIGL